jgi:hypothetical protein
MAKEKFFAAPVEATGAAAVDTTAADQALIEGLVAGTEPANLEAGAVAGKVKSPVTREWTSDDEKQHALFLTIITLYLDSLNLEPAVRSQVNYFIATIPSYWRGCGIGDYRTRMAASRGAANWPDVLKALNSVKEFWITASRGITKFNNFVAFVTPRGDGIAKVKVSPVELVPVRIQGVDYFVSKAALLEAKTNFAGDIEGLRAAILAVAQPAAVEEL